jgi:hypothetical protein
MDVKHHAVGHDNAYQSTTPAPANAARIASEIRATSRHVIGLAFSGHTFTSMAKRKPSNAHHLESMVIVHV